MNQLLSTAFIKIMSNNTLIHYFLLDNHFKIREISQLLIQKWYSMNNLFLLLFLP